MHIHVTKKTVARAALSALALAGAAAVYGKLFHAYARRKARAHEKANIPFDPDLLYNRSGGEPLHLVDRRNDTTLILFEGFRVQVVEGMHRDWLEAMHRDHGVNVIVPVVGRQSMPFDPRNAPWYYRLDAREAVQIYDTYRAAVGPNHRIVVASSCSGMLPALAIAAKRRPDALVLMAPMTAAFGGPRRATRGLQLLARLMVEMPGMDRLVPFYLRTSGLGGWDIVNPEGRARAMRTIVGNLDWDAVQFKKLLEAVGWAQERLVPQVHDLDVSVVWGTEDSLVTCASVERLADDLARAGNRVRRVPLAETGHIVMLDHGAEAARRVILDALRPRPPRARESVDGVGVNGEAAG